MNPATSVLLLTTLIGASQGLFLFLYGAELAARAGAVAMADIRTLLVMGSAAAVVLACGGLLASFFHLGHPERAWRAAAKWRTSWLSREVIVLPAFIGACALFGLAHWLDWPWTLLIGAAGSALCIALFVCTAMIYACLRFLQEWSTPLTVVNYGVLGSASGLTLAAALCAFAAPELMATCVQLAVLATVLGLVTRSASLVRNARLRPKSTLQSAIGVRHPRIVQKSQGFMGGSFNTREFFHGKSRLFFRSVKWAFLLLAFVVPLLLLWAAGAAPRVLLPLAFAIQYAGMLLERWFFFAEANHPQNLYYQAIS